MPDTLAPIVETPAPVQATPPPAPEPAGGFFQNLVDVYFAPRQAFARITRNPGFVLPLLGQLVLVAAFTGIWLSKVDAREFMKTQLEESGQMDKIPAERRAAVIDMAPMQIRIGGAIGLVFTPLMLLVVGAVLMFVYRFFYASEVTFRQSLSVTAWSFFALALVSTPLVLLVLQLKGDWNLNPQEVLQANLGLFVEKASTAKPLWSLLTSIDLFTLWLVFLLATGFAVASKKTTGSALWGVALPWLVIVLGKAAWAAIF